MAGQCHLLTGHQGIAHVTGEDQAKCNIGTFGDDIFYISELPTLTMTTANNLRIGAYNVCCQGRFSICQADDVVIESGTQTGFRKDTVYLRYQNIEGIESVDYYVEKGTVASIESEAQRGVSQYEGLRIDDGSPIVDFPLFLVTIANLNPDPSYFVQNKNNKVISEGTSGKWGYRKWSNGIAEMWYNNQGKTDSNGWLRDVSTLPFEININKPCGLSASGHASGDIGSGIRYVAIDGYRLPHFIDLYVSGSTNTSCGCSVCIECFWK